MHAVIGQLLCLYLQYVYVSLSLMFALSYIHVNTVGPLGHFLFLN